MVGSDGVELWSKHASTLLRVPVVPTHLGVWPKQGRWLGKERVLNPLPAVRAYLGREPFSHRQKNPRIYQISTNLGQTRPE